MPVHHSITIQPYIPIIVIMTVIFIFIFNNFSVQLVSHDPQRELKRRSNPMLGLQDSGFRILGVSENRGP